MSNGALATSASRGFLIARVDMSTITNTATWGMNGTGTAGIMVYNTGTGNGFTPGLYIWTGSAWQQTATSSSSWASTGNAGTTAGTNFIGTTDAQDFVTKTNNTEKMRVTSAGNVGIGTTAPSSLLNVVGKSVEAAVSVDRYDVYDGTSARITLRKSLNATIGSHTALTDGNQIGAIDYYASNGTGFPSVGSPNASIKGQASGAQSPTSTGGELTFNTTQSGTITNVERMRITDAGNVGIGTVTPTHKLHVIGTAGLSTGTAWTNTSDMRLKENVKTYNRGLKEIMQIKPIYYEYTENSGLKNAPEFGANIGISAQELEKIIPEAIGTREMTLKDGTILKDGKELVKADAMWFALINATKELNAKAEAKEAEVKELKAENEAIKAEIEALKAAVKALTEKK